MDFNDGNNFLSDWEYNVGETGNFEEPMEMAWTEQDLTSGYFASDFVDYSKVPTFSQNWEHAGIVSQASGPCTPISNHSRLLTPVSSPQGCYFDQDISYSGFCNPLGIVSHLPTPPSSQPGNFAGFSDPHSSFEFSYQSSHMTPSYHFNSSQRFNPSPVDSNFEPYPEVSTSSVPFAHMLSWLFGKPHVFYLQIRACSYYSSIHTCGDEYGLCCDGNWQVVDPWWRFLGHKCYGSSAGSLGSVFVTTMVAISSPFRTLD